MFRRYLEAGQIVNTHGIKGEVNVLPWCDSPEFLTRFEGFFFGDGVSFKKVESARINKNVVIMRFEGVGDIDGAIKLVKSVLYIDREWVSLPKGSYFEQDLIDLRVEDANTGRIYGVLREVGRTGANDIYRVDDGVRKVWIPAVKEIVRTVDIEGGRMLITPIKGLFDDED
jgi:16S rRNA processing protein RimM